MCNSNYFSIGTSIVQHDYTCDSTNNSVEYLNFLDGSTSYDYDFLGQLIGADYANAEITDESYTYDSNGNRVVANGSNYTTSTNNELTSDSSYTYTYDDEGNRISKTNSTHRELYEWDYRNRLTSVTKQEFNAETQEWTTVQIVEYTYDYNNVWIRKVLDSNGDGTADSKTIFIPENYQTTVQLDDTNLTDANGPAITHHYLWTPNQQDKLLADVTADNVLWTLTDHLGSIRDIIQSTATGVVTQAHIIYDAYGNVISCKNSTGETISNPILFGYTGKAFDTSTQLQNNINRWYDATIGRWLSTDPIGFSGIGNNLYAYVGNNPLSYLDKFGLIRDFNITAINACWLTYLEGVGDNVLSQIGHLLHGQVLLEAANTLAIELMFKGIPIPDELGSALTVSALIEIAKAVMEKEVNNNNTNVAEIVVEALASTTGNRVTQFEVLKPIIEQLVRNTANFSQSECKLVTLTHDKEPNMRWNGEKVRCTLYYCAKTTWFWGWTKSWSVSGNCSYVCTNALPGGGTTCCGDAGLPTKLATRSIFASGTGVGSECNVTQVY